MIRRVYQRELWNCTPAGWEQFWDVQIRPPYPKLPPDAVIGYMARTWLARLLRPVAYLCGHWIY